MGLAPDIIVPLLDTAQQYIHAGRVNSIRFSTRPDTINEHVLAIIDGYSIAAVELGVQSMADDVLRKSGRGHTADDTVNAIHLLKNKYRVGIQMMVGLPGDSDEKSLASARKIVDLKPGFVRIYPTLVLDHSPLAEWYKKGLYQPLEIGPCVRLVKKLYMTFQDNGIPVIRMGLQGSEDLDERSILAGPFHPAFGHLVHAGLFLDKALKIIETQYPDAKNIQIQAHPRSVSKMRGDKNSNVKILKKKFRLDHIEVVSNERILEDGLRVIQTDPLTRHNHSRCLS